MQVTLSIDVFTTWGHSSELLTLRENHNKTITKLLFTVIITALHQLKKENYTSIFSG